MKYTYNIQTFIWLIFFVSIASIQVFAKKYPIQNFSPQEYKAGIQNIDFAQNRNMTLYTANNLGVLEYNGLTWMTHASKTGKKMRSLAFDEISNRLFLGSQGEFGYFENDWNYVSLIDKIPVSAQDFDEVWDVFLINTKVYFCTFSGIFIYNGDTITYVTNDTGLDRCFLANGKLFTQNQRGQLFLVDESKLIPFNHQNQSNQIITGVIPNENEYLIFYNSGDIESTSRFKSTTQFKELSNALRGTYVNHVLQLSDTRLAISTQTSGLFLYDFLENTFDNITTIDGLESNACLRSFQDYAGNLWVGMQNGIAQIYINSPMRLINEEINLQGSGYETIESDNGTYYSTSNGIYYLAKNATQGKFINGTEGPAYGMTKIARKLYAGHHTGLFLLENGTARRIASTDGLWKIKQLQSNPEYCIGGTYSGLYLFKMNDRSMLEPIKEIQGFNESSRFFEEDSQGNIWVGQYYKGLYKLAFDDQLQDVTVQQITGNENLSLNEQIILGKVDNELYIATNNGMYKLDPTTNNVTKAEIFTKTIGEQPVYLFVQDNQRNVHLIAENKVGFFKQISVNNYVFVPSSLFQLRYHLNNDLLNVSVNNQNGVMYSANKGFIHYNPQLESQAPVLIPLSISKIYSTTQDSLLYFRKPFEAIPQSLDRLILDHMAKDIQIEVESFQFNDMNSHQFRYFLKGFDEDYGEWTNTHTKEYTNLNEGEYEFLAQTRNHLGEITTSFPLIIKVNPPFHRSLVAKIIYFFSAILALIFVAMVQRRRYKSKAIKIDEENKIKLKEEKLKLLKTKQEKEKELQQLKDEKMQSEIQHINKLLAASTMNLVVKNEFIEMIKGQLNELKRTDKGKESKHTLEYIVKEIDTSLKINEDWEQFQYHFDKVHGDFLSRLKDEFHELTPNEHKLCAFLRLNLSTKEIANFMSISHRGVEIARYRLRKKLDLIKGKNLSKFILDY